jgi:hypothetical protein
MSRGVNIRCRLLCGDCAELRSIASISEDRCRIQLQECQHLRPETLPRKGIGLEDANSEIGWRLYPATRDGDRTTSLPYERPSI